MAPQLVTKSPPGEQAFLDLAQRFYRAFKRSDFKAAVERIMSGELATLKARKKKA